jgi:hypothetical protein
MQRILYKTVGWAVSTAVLLHALAGCCTHHAHDTTGELMCGTPSSCEHDHHGEEGPDQGSGKHDEHDGADCEEGRCVLQAPSVRTGLDLSSAPAFSTVSPVWRTASMRLCDSVAFDVGYFAAGRFALPVRAHLALGVLQI